MASHAVRVKVRVITVLIFFCLACLPPKSDGSSTISQYYYEQGFVRRRMVVGSRPPKCANKCFSCRPCMATLVIPPPHQTKSFAGADGERDEGYYLLSWKCRCGNKLFDP